jgi:GSH-dependent disulfide-bond oxidoreductase
LGNPAHPRDLTAPHRRRAAPAIPTPQALRYRARAGPSRRFVFGNAFMIDLYALTSPNVQKVFIALEELSLPYRPIFIDVWKGEHFTPDFGKISLNRKIPVIVDHDGPGGKPYTVFESGAILMYLADKTGKLLPSDKTARFDALQWMMLQMASIGPMSGQLVHFSKFAPAGNDYAVSRFKTEVHRLWDVYEQRLSHTPYVGGAEYSIADIAVYPWLRNYEFLGMTFDGRPKLKAYVDMITARPAVQKMLAILPTIKSSRDTASDENRDRLFGRGKYARA